MHVHHQLTPRQLQAWRTIARLRDEADGLPPSLREVAAALDIHHSSAGAMRDRLAAAGVVSVRPGISRGVRLLVEPSADPARRSS